MMWIKHIMSFTIILQPLVYLFENYGRNCVMCQFNNQDTLYDALNKTCTFSFCEDVVKDYLQ